MANLNPTLPGYLQSPREEYLYNTHNPNLYTSQAQIGDITASLFGNKKELSQYKIDLILGDISARDRIRYDNLRSLYDDLLKIDNWRLKRDFPFNYATDKIWTDLNKMELQIRDQIRKELKDAAKDTAFPSKDLREGLLESKINEQKSKMLDGLEIGLDSPQHYQGDLHDRHETNIYKTYL